MKSVCVYQSHKNRTVSELKAKAFMFMVWNLEQREDRVVSENWAELRQILELNY